MVVFNFNILICGAQFGHGVTKDGKFNLKPKLYILFISGGLPPPGEDDIVVIGPNQYIYFDTTTPILTAIIIQSGSLIFDDNQDVNLNVGYIVITDGGTLQIGTRDKPFTHKAKIIMYGSVRSIELPIFGSKVIALRNG